MITLIHICTITLAAACVLCHILGIPDEPLHQTLIVLVSNEAQFKM
jgi:hypothetical protein